MQTAFAVSIAKHLAVYYCEVILRIGVNGMILCSRCGNPVEDQVKYCPCCGNFVEQIIAPVSDSAEPESVEVTGLPEQGAVPAETREIPEEAAMPVETSSLSEQTDVPDEAEALSEQVILPDEAPVQPIWVTRSKDLPLDEILDDSFLDEPSGDAPVSRLDSSEFPSHFDSLNSDKVDEDIFDEIFDSTTQLYSNMSPKLKKIIIITLVSTLLSIIPVVYAACSHRPQPSLDSYIQVQTVSSSSNN